MMEADFLLSAPAFAVTGDTGTIGSAAVTFGLATSEEEAKEPMKELFETAVALTAASFLENTAGIAGMAAAGMTAAGAAVAKLATDTPANLLAGMTENKEAAAAGSAADLTVLQSPSGF